MRGSPISNPVRRLVPALLGAVGGAMLVASPAQAADATPPASVGPPTPLLPTPPPNSGALFATAPFATAHSAPAPPPGKHAAAVAQRIPLDAKPLIPPAVVPAKLDPPPASRPALSLETNLEPLGTAGSAPSQPALPGAEATPAAKPPSS
jgi:hypothetical protein